MITTRDIAARARAAALLASTLLAGAGAHAVATTDACPKELTVKQAIVTDIPGWTSVNQQEGYPFARIAFFRGPPANDARLVPSSENRNATGLHDIWRLPKQADGYWVQCQYGNTAAVVIRKLDDDNDFCLADYDPRFATLVVKHWICMAWQPPREHPKPRPKSPSHWTHGQ